jgi:ubiquinone/menaquinone biosynthesis C-methylase UbiE
MTRGLTSLTRFLPGNRSAERLQRNLEECSVPNQWSGYFEEAEGYMPETWEDFLWPKIRGADFSSVLEIGPGAGRNTAMLSQHAKEIYCVDLNEYALKRCRERFANYGGSCVFHFHRNDGHSLPMIHDDSITFIYSYDSMVHCSKEVMRSYIREFSRVIRPNGLGFIHHSNLGAASSKRSFKENPHWRTDMSKSLFARYCDQAGLRCVEQKVINWGEARDLDCISIFTKDSRN